MVDSKGKMNLRDQFIRVLNEYDEMYKKVWDTQVLLVERMKIS